jgi:hypothetical protein
MVTQYIDYYLISATDYHGTWMLTTGVSTPNKEVVSFQCQLAILSLVLILMRYFNENEYI